MSGAAPTRKVTKEEVENLGDAIVLLMNDSQLKAASMQFVRVEPMKHYLVTMKHLEQAWLNHWQRVIRMPAGGAHAGGAMQSGFEMELVTSCGIRQLMGGWPNHQSIRFGHSWELRTMEEVAEALNFTKWGVMNGKPIPPVSGSSVHAGLILAAPPVTVTWRLRTDATTALVVRFPMVIWREDNSTILPPDDAMGIPFYVDPVDRPGYHRDIFQAWARKVLGELVSNGFPMSAQARTHLPQAYLSGESSCEEEEAES